MRFRKKLREEGWQVPDGDSPVTPMMLGDVEIATEMGRRLRDGGVLVGMVRPPTVPHGTSRLRFSLKAELDLEVLAERILQTLRTAGS